ncbi:MAG: UDP-4-amino-4,6-dideoxy-N-acetyl-beta-L-altrosamine transaminase [Legionella sp.]|nr:UDP-4-amino-4,6-dideoxy-N-acetyl-beta-L-altrosamine transaminase [Legionella sp.]
MIPYGRQDISPADIAAVVEVLQSDWLTQGPTVVRFEQAVAEKVGANYAVAVNSATSALHIACLALDLGHGDYLWTSPNTFVASANCGLYCGAKVDFVDICPKTYNMDVDALSLKLEQAAHAGTLPKVVIPVHFAGQSCDMAKIHALSERYGFKIIEDASHAIGGRFNDQLVGSGVYSDITIFSFHPVKIITTGEGGMALTNNPGLAERMQRLRAHGITRDPEQIQSPSPGAWYYEQIELGFNYRMTDIQAALGLSQLQRLDEFLIKRQGIASIYDEALANLPLIRPFRQPNTYSAFHLYVIQLDKNHSKANRTDLFAYLREAGIGVNVHYIPVHYHPYYQQAGFCRGNFPKAEFYYNNAISLPMFVTLSDDDQNDVINALQRYFDNLGVSS